MKSRLVGGKYEIIREIAEGGVGRIFLATDRSNDRNVVLKIPVEESDILCESLKNEYLFAYRHRHPSLLKPLDLFFDSDKPILVTPFMEGGTLGKYTDFLKTSSTPDGFLPKLKGIMAEILEAAGFIHFSGYCYNDFKPSNFIAREHNEDESAPVITLIDFNLVTRIGDRPKRGGTLHYLAPEVLCGYPPSVVSDIYSLGVLFYQFSTGNLPYDSADESELIAGIINAERIDFEAVPSELRPGLGSLLSHDFEKRPRTALQAAEALGLADDFTALCKARIDYYLKSGQPPFAAELAKRLDQFDKSTARKLFYINGYYNGTCPMNFFESQYRVEGKECFRISRDENDDEINAVFSGAISDDNPIPGNKIILIDDLEMLNDRHLEILSDIVNNREEIRIAAAGGRWVDPGIKREIFDPLKLWSAERSTKEALKAFLKRDVADIDLETLQDQTGGDPEQIHNILRYYYKLPGTAVGDNFISPEDFGHVDTVIENRFIYKRIYHSLGPEQQELIAMLSAWENTIPLLLFVKFGRKKRDIAESLIKRGFLIRHKDSVSFISRGFREYIYDETAERTRNDFHRFWAMAAEEFISDNEERLELSAYHWGLSGDTERAYKYNESAAKEFYKNGDFIRARRFAETLLQANPQDLSLEKFALRISGDIYGAMGHFNSARKMYLRILARHRDRETQAEIKRKLGGIYIASGEFDKSLYYIKRSLEYYKDSRDKNALSKCEFAVTEAFMGKKEYPKSLELMINAARDFNGFNLKTDPAESYGSRGVRNELPGLNSIITIAHRIKNYKIMIKAYFALGQCYLKSGDIDEAVIRFNKALEISENNKQKNEIIASLINLGSCHFIRGDLFMAIECFQNARQAADSAGNYYLKTLAELKLTDVSLAMGNFVLARDVLELIEHHEIYNENKQLKLLVDIRRAELLRALGNREKSLDLAKSIYRAASIRNKHWLALLADLIICKSQKESHDNYDLERLKGILLGAEKHGLSDLAGEAKLALGEYHLNNGNYQDALTYFEDISESRGIPRHLKLKSSIHLATIAARQNRHTEAIENVIVSESSAAASGFIPLALQAAEILGELYFSRGRADLSEDCRGRAGTYLEKILSALPEGYSVGDILEQLKSAGAAAHFITKTVISSKPAPVEIRESNPAIDIDNQAR